ncbi:MAG: hypothetical protein H7319_13995 [Spirosoma sp.]|nr:hypothetical protein [Spirosoma sp.]
MKRYSILYLLNEQYQHIGSATYPEAQAILQKVVADPKRVPVGIYDGKTELFEWEPGRQHEYNTAGIDEQGKLAEQVIPIAQALRYRDVTWQRASNFRRPGFFA